MINLRLKGNAIYWLKDSAEAMLQIRALVLTNRWDERLQALRELRTRDGRSNWRFTPRDMRAKVEHATGSTA